MWSGGGVCGGGGVAPYMEVCTDVRPEWPPFSGLGIHLFCCKKKVYLVYQRQNPFSKIGFCHMRTTKAQTSACASAQSDQHLCCLLPGL